MTSYGRKGYVAPNSSTPESDTGYSCREIAEPVILSKYIYHGFWVKHGTRPERESLSETGKVSPKNDGKAQDSPGTQPGDTHFVNPSEKDTIGDRNGSFREIQFKILTEGLGSEEPSINLFTDVEFNYRSSINTIITDKKIYKPLENIRAAVFAPSLRDVSVALIIRNAGIRTQTLVGKESLRHSNDSDALYKEVIQLNRSGAGFCSFPGIEAGMYEMALIIANNRFSSSQYDLTSFSVAEYSLSLLEAKLHKYKISGGKFSLDARITRLNSPFTGKVSAEICDNKTGREILSKELFVNQGAMSVEFELPPKSPDPFHLRIITEDGGTAEIHFPEKPSGAESEISLGKLGNHFAGSIHPIPGSRDLGWFNAALVSRGTFPLELWEICAEKAVLRSTCALKKAQVVLINPLYEKCRIFNYYNVEKGREFSFEIDFPYTVIHAAAWGESPMESWEIVFRKSEIGLELETPDIIEPGQEMKIRLKSTKPVKCLLTIADSRVETEDPVKKAGGKIYRTIEGYKNLSSGELREIDEKLQNNYRLFQVLINRSDAIEELRTLYGAEQYYHWELSRATWSWQ